MFNLLLKYQKFNIFRHVNVRGLNNWFLSKRRILNFFFINKFLNSLDKVVSKVKSTVKKNKLNFFFIKYLTVRGGFRRIFRKGFKGLTINFFKKKINFFKKSFIIGSYLFFLKRKRKKRKKGQRFRRFFRKNWRFSFKSRPLLKDMYLIKNKETPLGYRTWFFKSSNKGRFFLKRW